MVRRMKLPTPIILMGHLALLAEKYRGNKEVQERIDGLALQLKEIETVRRDLVLGERQWSAKMLKASKRLLAAAPDRETRRDVRKMVKIYRGMNTFWSAEIKDTIPSPVTEN